MPSPVSHVRHGRPHALVVMWLATYEAATPGVQVADNATVRLDLDNEPQPDALLLLDPARGGQARIDHDGYVAGAPELVVEVAASSASYDLHEKLTAYRRNGVREYIVWRVDDGAIDWFELRRAEYLLREPDAETLKSPAFPGLWLDPAALIRRDGAAVLRRLHEGLASADHAAFIEGLSPA